MRLFTDFRYAEKARLLGLEVVELPRNLFGGIADHLPGRVEFEAEHLTYAAWAALGGGGAELVPRSELLEGVRAVKEPGELETIRRAAAITSECFARLAGERFVGRTERELAWWLESLMHELGAEGPAFPVDRRRGRERRVPACELGRPDDRGGNDGRRRCRREARRVLLGLHADVRHRRAPGPAGPLVRGLPGRAGDVARRHGGGGGRARRRLRRARRDRGGRPGRAVRARAGARRRHGDPRAAASAPGE